MRVALVAPLVSPIVDPFLGGSQALLFDLATALAEAGHQVTLFAADGSIVPTVEVVRLGIDSHRLRPTRFSQYQPVEPAVQEAERASFLRIAYEIRRRANDFDVVHNHAFDAPAFELLHDAHPHVCHTLHLPPIVPSVTQAARQAAEGGATLVSVSCWAQQSWEIHVGRTVTVKNGAPTHRIQPGAGARDGWLYVGRIAPEKGLDDALQVCEEAGRSLRVIGAPYDADYYDRIRPRLAGHQVLGSLPRDRVFTELGRAEGVLMPVAWDEPFGLVAVEAMAAGTPVAAYARGALPELISEGESGYLVDPGDVNGLRAAAERFHAIDHQRCREWAVQRFDLSRMMTEYVSLYREIG